MAVAMDGTGGYRLFEFDAQGELRRASPTLWPGERVSPTPALAVSGDVLAIAGGVQSSESGDAVCRFALVDLRAATSIRAPARFSDEPDPDSIRGDAGFCNVVALQDGFMLVWQQYTSSTSSISTVFAQRIGRDGSPSGDRLSLAEVADSRSGKARRTAW